MTDTKNIMRLKTVAPRRDTAEITPPIALQRAIYRAAHLGLGLTLDITETRADQCDRDGVLSGVQPTDLIVKLTQEDEVPGVMALDLDLVSALVEVQTLGAAMDAPATSRKVTSTDAAVALPLIDGTLSGFESLLAQANEAEPPGFHFGDWLRDLNLLAAQLPDGPYDSFEVTVSIGKNGRAGRLFLALPVPPKPAPPDPQIKENAAQDSLSAEIMDAPARLDVVLHRMELPLGEIGAMRPGDTLTLPIRALSEVTLHAGDRKPVATGVLGQLSGQRAVCLKVVGAGRGKTLSSPAEQAQTLAEVDLADPGLISPPNGPQPTPDAPIETMEPENADDILRDLGLSEGLPKSTPSSQSDTVPALPADLLPGPERADG